MKILYFKSNIKNALVISFLLWVLLPIPLFETIYIDTLTGGEMRTHWTYGSAAWRAVEETNYIIFSGWDFLFFLFLILTSYFFYFLVTLGTIKIYRFLKKRNK